YARVRNLTRHPDGPHCICPRSSLVGIAVDSDSVWLRLDRPFSAREEHASNIRSSVLVVHKRLQNAGVDAHRQAVGTARLKRESHGIHTLAFSRRRIFRDVDSRWSTRLDFVFLERLLDPPSQFTGDSVLLTRPDLCDHQIVHFRSVHPFNSRYLRLCDDGIAEVWIVPQFLTHFLKKFDYSIRGFAVVDRNGKRDL